MSDAQKIWMTLTGLPLEIELQWPFHQSTSGADFWVLHGDLRIVGTELHALVSVNLSQTVREVLPSLELGDAEAPVINALRKEVDRRQIEFARSGKLLPVAFSSLCGQGQFPDRFRSERLAGCGVGGIDRGDLRRNLHFLADRSRFQGYRHLGRFRDAHFNAVPLGLGESGFVHHHGITTRREQRHNKRTVRVRGYPPHHHSCARIDDFDIRSSHRPAGRVHHRAADGARRTALAVSASGTQRSDEQCRGR